MDNDKQLTVKDFFFCYNKEVMFYLKENNIDFIVQVLSDNTKKRYFMYQKTDKLNQALNDYKNIK